MENLIQSDQKWISIKKFRSNLQECMKKFLRIIVGTIQMTEFSFWWKKV